MWREAFAVAVDVVALSSAPAVHVPLPCDWQPMAQHMVVSADDAFIRVS
jgi:hypothetical protein